jgi:hypothetical protein
MEVEVSAEAKDKRLNRAVALTVVVLSIVTGLCNIKDGNLVQSMQQAKADSVDTWNEYQASRTKLHISETGRAEIIALATTAAEKDAASATLANLDSNIARYRNEAPKLKALAQAQGDSYDALNIHDDQFDAGDAAISTAIAMAAVAALAESSLLLYASWAFGAFGIFMGICGFAKLPFHPDILSTFLG